MKNEGNDPDLSTKKQIIKSNPFNHPGFVFFLPDFVLFLIWGKRGWNRMDCKEEKSWVYKAGCKIK